MKKKDDKGLNIKDIEKLKGIEKEKYIKKRLDETEKRINFLIKKQKGFLKAKESIIKMKEPVILLMRKDMSISVHENESKDKFQFEATDKSEGEIDLSSAKPYYLQYGDDKIKIILCDEKSYTTYPIEPLFDMTTINQAIDKIIHNITSRRGEKQKELTKLIWTIGLTIALILGVLILYKMFVPQKPEVIINMVNSTGEIIKNATKV